MEINLEFGGQSYQCDLSKGIDLSSTYGDPNREPCAWHAEPARSEPIRQGEWVGSVQEGSPVNFYRHHLSPHGNGTHTEGFGHISPGREPVGEGLSDFHFIAWLNWQQPQDGLLRLADLQQSWPKKDPEALILLTELAFPQDFSGQNPPAIEVDIMTFIRQAGVQHLLTNLPSVDPEEDDGALAAHKAFWHYPQKPDPTATITELLFAPAELKRGWYLLNLQVAPLHGDASPSRPVIYPLESF